MLLLGLCGKWLTEIENKSKFHCSFHLLILLNPTQWIVRQSMLWNRNGQRFMSVQWLSALLIVLGYVFRHTTTGTTGEFGWQYYAINFSFKDGRDGRDTYRHKKSYYKKKLKCYWNVWKYYSALLAFSSEPMDRM